MKCALCSNEENLLIQVQAGTGLSLHLCPEHEHLPLFEVAARLAADNKKLRGALESISENSLHRFNCSASMLSDNALEHKNVRC